MTLCVRKDCNKRVEALHLCGKHRMRLYRARNPLYSTYHGIKQRCYNPNCKEYPLYGGRGIKMCDRWLGGYDNFIQDMGQKPSSKYSIERIDNDGDYTPENCKWATQHEQNLNQRIRRDNALGHRGIVLNKLNSNFRAYIYVSGKQVNLGSYPVIEDAIVARLAGEKKYFS